MDQPPFRGDHHNTGYDECPPHLPGSATLGRGLRQQGAEEKDYKACSSQQRRCQDQDVPRLMVEERPHGFRTPARTNRAPAPLRMERTSQPSFIRISFSRAGRVRPPGQAAAADAALGQPHGRLN